MGEKSCDQNLWSKCRHVPRSFILWGVYLEGREEEEATTKYELGKKWKDEGERWIRQTVYTGDKMGLIPGMRGGAHVHKSALEPTYQRRPLKKLYFSTRTQTRPLMLTAAALRPRKTPVLHFLPDEVNTSCSTVIISPSVKCHAWRLFLNFWKSERGRMDASCACPAAHTMPVPFVCSQRPLVMSRGGSFGKGAYAYLPFWLTVMALRSVHSG